jgi:hypothetical protein
MPRRLQTSGEINTLLCALGGYRGRIEVRGTVAGALDCASSVTCEAAPEFLEHAAANAHNAAADLLS